MSFLSNVIKTVAPVVATIAPLTGPTGMVIGAVAGEKARSDARKKSREDAEIAKRNREMQKAEIFGTGNVSTIQPTRLGSTANTGGFGSGFGEFVMDVGRNILNPIANVISPFLGGGSMQPAKDYIPMITGPSETSTSGSTDAFIGGLPSIASRIPQILGNPLVGGAVGTAVGLGLDLLDPVTGKKRRVTRKMKSQARMLLNLNMGNLDATAAMLNIDQQTLVAILLKRFRNDGPVVTKAALRKTKSTVHKLKNMCDMYDSLRPAARRRTTTMKRAGTTLISNK